MTQARRLRPKAPDAGRKMPQCCVPVEEMSATALGPPGWRERRYRSQGLDPGRCSKQQVVEIDGKGYCSFHGGEKALALLLGEET